MSGYLVKHESVAIAGVANLEIRSLLDRQQYCDPEGAAEAEGISSAAWPLFGLLWPSSLQLAARLALRPVDARERILEVGCGLAIASLVGHRRGANVTASDCHPLTRGFLLENLRLNALAPLPYCHGNWDAPDDDPAVSLHGDPVAGRFELIIGSDVLYERDEAGTLPLFIGRHAARVGEVWIVDPNRGNRSAFHRRMAGLGYEMHETTIREPLGTLEPYSGRWLRYRRA